MKPCNLSPDSRPSLFSQILALSQNIKTWTPSSFFLLFTYRKRNNSFQFSLDLGKSTFWSTDWRKPCMDWSNPLELDLIDSPERRFPIKQSHPFTRHHKGKLTLFIVYVDDIVMTIDYKEEMMWMKLLAQEFEIKDLGRLQYFMQIGVARSKRGIFISERKYILNLLKKLLWASKISYWKQSQISNMDWKG